jgi:hypothetical protein
MEACWLAQMSDFSVTLSLLIVANMDAPACPLPITHPTLSEARRTDTISEKTVAEVEILYLDLMLTCCHASLVSANQPVVLSY